MIRHESIVRAVLQFSRKTKLVSQETKELFEEQPYTLMGSNNTRISFIQLFKRYIVYLRLLL